MKLGSVLILLETEVGKAPESLEVFLHRDGELGVRLTSESTEILLSRSAVTELQQLLEKASFAMEL